MQVLEVNSDNYDDLVINSDTPVLLDITATWCKYCKVIMPAIDDIADEYCGRLKVCTADVDKFPEVADMFGICSVPSIILINKHECTAMKGTPTSNVQIGNWLAAQGIL